MTNSTNTKSKETLLYPSQNQFHAQKNPSPIQSESTKDAIRAAAHRLHHQIQAVLHPHHLEEAQVHPPANQAHLQTPEAYQVGLESMRERSTKITTRRKINTKEAWFTNHLTAHRIKKIKRSDRTVSIRSLRIAVRMLMN